MKFLEDNPYKIRRDQFMTVQAKRSLRFGTEMLRVMYVVVKSDYAKNMKM